MLADRRCAVMARTTSSQDLSVVDPVCRREDVRIVTIFANVGRLYVRRTFADRIDTIVATGTIIDDTEVIECCWSPRDGCVAVVTGVTACNMSWMLTRCDNAIVAAVAGADNLCVIHREDRCKDVGIVTVLANITGLNVRQVFTDGVDTVMAVNTISGDVQMVEVGG